MRRFTSTRPLPFVPTQGVTGLIEKRLTLHSVVDLSDSASATGEWGREASSTLLLDADATTHLNHGSDPATHTLNLGGSVGWNWDYPRGITDTIALDDHVHASLDGFHAPAAERYELTANEAVVTGQPVYISGNNTINLASAADNGDPSLVFGLVLTGATANNVALVVADGSVTQADWTAVIGTTNLTPGDVYYLGTVAGTLSATPPTGNGEVVTMVGTAITPTKFDIEINERAKL